MLIEQFRPIWNVLIDGFGDNDPGSRRATQYCSPSDVLHPGRGFAAKLAPGPLSTDAITAKIKAYFAGDDVMLVPPESVADPGEEDEN